MEYFIKFLSDSRGIKFMHENFIQFCRDDFTLYYDVFFTEIRQVYGDDDELVRRKVLNRIDTCLKLN